MRSVYTEGFLYDFSSEYQALASLQENEQHQEENRTAVNQVWQGMKNAWGETGEETLGRKSKQLKAYANIDTLKKIQARKKVKDELNRCRTIAKRAEAQIRYSEANKEVKRSIGKDRRNFVDDRPRQAEEAAGRGDGKGLYSITRTLAGVRKNPDRHV